MMLKKQLHHYKTRVENQLSHYFNEKNKLNHAMRYSVLNGGKRIRPALVYLTGELLGAPIEALDIPACAIEILHSFSLVHDDLPALDNDDLRRGKPTCHKAFDEATAILTGDALLIFSFDILSLPTSQLDAYQQSQMVQCLAKASGAMGMTQGQSLDMENKTDLTLDQLVKIHTLKTGALLEACVSLACITAKCQDQKKINALQQYAKHLGLAFQIKDDLLDAESSTEQLGKTAQSDINQNKITFPALLGVEKAKKECQKQHTLAIACLSKINLDQSPLATLSSYLTVRNF